MEYIRKSLATSYKLRATGLHAQRGVTLIDAIVGSALMLVVFIGIAAVFQLSIDVVSNNKARAGALALANERIEYARSLAYDEIGTLGGIPTGPIAQTETVVANNVSYTRRTLVAYGDDPADGLAGADSNGVTIDYKMVKAEVSWTARNGTRRIILVTRASPPNGMEVACPPSAQCGTLVINVLDAATLPVSNATVRIVNANTSPAIDTTYFTPESGIVTVLGAPVATGYAVTVTKPGYSTDQTYSATAENTNPTPGHFTVSNNQITEGTFRIDLLSALTLQTFTVLSGEWEDTFANMNNISSSSHVEVSGNQLRLEGNQPYLYPGEARSVAIAPTAVLRWKEFTVNDSTPGESGITYRFYYPTGSGAALIPDSVLPGNSAGFTSAAPIALSAVSAIDYPSIILDAYLSVGDPNAPAPSIQDWSASYDYGSSINATLSMQGDKTIGSGPGGVLYKYNNTSLSTGGSGSVTLPSMEWGTYTIEIITPANRVLSSSCPTLPLYLSPNTPLTAKLYFTTKTAHSLLVDVKNSAGTILPGASVRLEKGGSYDETLKADGCGSAFFSSLTNGNYTITVSNPGNQQYSSGVNVSGTTRLSVVLN